MTENASINALARVVTLCELGRYHEAIPLARQAVAANASDVRAWCLLAQACLGADSDADALDAARRASSLAPDDEWPQRLASVALCELGRYEEGLKAALEAVRLAPILWQPHLRVAMATQHLRRFDQAADALARATQLGPLQPEVFVAAGNLALARGRVGEAEVGFRRALALDPQSVGAHDGLARMHLREAGPIGNRFANAHGMAAAARGFATAIRTDPRSSTSRYNLGVVVRMFLSRLAYFVFLDAYVVLRLGEHSGSGVARVLPALALAFPASFAVKFIAGLTPPLRQHLWRELFRIRLALTAVPVAVAALLLLFDAVAPTPDRGVIGGAAVGCSALGRLAVFVESRFHVRSRSSRRWWEFTTSTLTVVLCLGLGLGLGVVIVVGTLGSANLGWTPLILAALPLVVAAAAAWQLVRKRRLRKALDA